MAMRSEMGCKTKREASLCCAQREMSSVLRADETALRERKKKQRTRQNLLEVQKLQIHDKLLKEEGPYIKETVQDKVCC